MLSSFGKQYGIPSIQELLSNKEDQSPWVANVTTGDRKDSGTDATVWISLGDREGKWTLPCKLSQVGINTHERGQTDTFPLSKSVADFELFGDLVKLEVWRDSFGVNDSWFVEVISVHNILNGKEFNFPVHRWIKAKKHYFFQLYDTALPQTDEYHQQRQEELAEKKKEYQYIVRTPGDIHAGLPAQVKDLPKDETFSDSYKFGFVAYNKVKGQMDRKLIALVTGGAKKTWSSMEELDEVYKFSMPIPGSREAWSTDEWFGQQRLQGANPIMIRLCTAIPANFPVDHQVIEKILQCSVSEAIAKKRLFYTDHKICERLPIPEENQICAPIALFFLDKTDRRNLFPLAIQLQQTPGEKNPIFYPTDGEAWLLAKMWYNNADSNLHQASTHVGLTHMLMEGIAICANRNLSPSHPLFRLLAPHFFYLLAVNTIGLAALIKEGGWIDRTFPIGRAGMFDLIRRGAEGWRLDTNGLPPADCKARGVDDPAVLPNYLYRDDAVAVYKAIHKYVAAVVEFYYDAPEKILKDEELQNFARELVVPTKDGGVGIRGVPLTNGKFTTTKQITDALSGIISTCSMQHAAVNFCQYSELAYPPNYPTKMNGVLPTKKHGFTPADIISQLPTKETTLDIMAVALLLSAKATKSLGDFEVKYLYDPVSVRAAKRFRRDLEDISEAIRERNVAAKTNRFPYPWLDPEFIPNAISI